jgi:hypothetical protein
MNPVFVYVMHVVCIYLLWRYYETWQRQRGKVLRERVAYLLWSAAQRVRSEY